MNKKTLIIGGIAAAAVVLVLVLILVSGQRPAGPADAARTGADATASVEGYSGSGAEDGLRTDAAGVEEDGGTVPGLAGPRDSAAGAAANAAAEAGAAPPPTFSVAGIVTSADTGAPVPEAAIRVTAFVANGGQLTFEALTGNEGEYEIETPLTAEDLPGETEVSAYVDVRAQGLMAVRRQRPAIDGETRRAEVNFALPGSETISGRVVNQYGQGVEDARVETQFVGEPGIEGYRMYERVQTDDAGRFELAGVPIGGLLDVRASKEGYSSGRAAEVRAGSEGVEIVLFRGEARLEGVLFAHDGTPVPNASFSAVQIAGEEGNPPESPRNLRARGNDQGEFVFDTIGAGTWRVQPGSGGIEVISQEVELAFGDTKSIEFTLPPPNEYTIRAVDVETGEGVEGVVLEWRHKSGLGLSFRPPNPDPHIGTAVTGPDGYATVAVLESGYSTNLNWTPPVPWLPARVQARTSISLRPNEEDPRNQTIYLRRGFPFTVRTVSPAGNPVSATVRSQLTGSPREEGETDANGFATFTGAPGLTATITARSESGTGSAEVTFEEEPPSQPVEVILEASATVRGRVLAGDKPVPIIYVTFRPEGTGGDGALAITSGEGFFEATGVPPGRVEVSLGRQQYTGSGIPDYSHLSRPAPVVIDLEPGEVREDLVLRMTQARAFEGVVLDENDQPIEGASVTGRIAYEPINGPFGRTLTTDENGFFFQEGLPEDARLIGVSVQKDGFVPLVERWIDRPAPELPLVLVLERQKQRQMEVVTAGSLLPVERYEYRLQDYGPWNTVNDPAGRTTLDLDPDRQTYMLHVRGLDSDGEPDGRFVVRSLSIEAGTVDDVLRVELADLEMAEGQVIWRYSDEPVEGATVALYPTNQTGDENILEQTTTSANGRFRLPIPKGSQYLLSAWKDGSSNSHRGTPDESGPIVIEITETEEYPLRLVDGSGTPLPGIRAEYRLEQRHNTPVEGEGVSDEAGVLTMLKGAGSGGVWEVTLRADGFPVVLDEEYVAVRREPLRLDVTLGSIGTVTGRIITQGTGAVEYPLVAGMIAMDAGRRRSTGWPGSDRYLFEFPAPAGGESRLLLGGLHVRNRSDTGLYLNEVIPLPSDEDLNIEHDLTLRFGAATVLIEHPALPEEPGGELVVTQMVESMPYPPKLRIRNPPVPTRLNWLPEGPYRVEWSDAADGFVADPITISVSADGEPALVELKVREMTGEERERLGLRR